MLYHINRYFSQQIARKSRFLPMFRKNKAGETVFSILNRYIHVILK